MAVYYRFYNTEEKRYLHAGYNGTLPDVRKELINYLDDETYQKSKGMFDGCTLQTICDKSNLQLEKRLGLPFEPHPEDIDFDRADRQRVKGLIDSSWKYL